MSAGIQTINATIPQIEDALRSGMTVVEVADRFQEPPATVYAVQRMLDSAEKVVDPRSIVSVAEMVAAAGRSQKVATQRLGERIADLVAQLRGRLVEEYEAKTAAAEVEALERRLREAKAKLRKRPQATKTPTARPSFRAAAGGSVSGEFPCQQGCGYVSKTAAGRGAHERHCRARGAA